jgi:hypothetical protein
MLRLDETQYGMQSSWCSRRFPVLGELVVRVQDVRSKRQGTNVLGSRACCGRAVAASVVAGQPTTCGVQAGPQLFKVSY